LLFAFLPDKKKKSGNKNEDREQQLKDEIRDGFKDKISVLAVSYHNLGVE